MKLRRGLRALVLITASCAHRPPAREAPAPAVPVASTPVRGAPIVPAVDHHMHLVSPEAAKTALPPLLPAIEVPAELARLLDERARRVGDAAAMAGLFADPPLVLHPLYPMWLRGQEAIDTVALNTRKGYRLVPLAYRVDGSAGFIAGTWVMGEGASASQVTSFMLSIVKGRDGAWRIAAEAFTAKGPPLPEVVTAAAIVEQLDAAGVRRGVVLSLAYQIGAPGDAPVADEYVKVRAENDWVAAQVATAPDRLVGFCGINPLKDHALAELERCSKLANIRGVKIHLGNARIDLRDPQQRATLRDFFAAANERRVAIVVHLMTLRSDYGREDAQIFLRDIVAAAPDITIQIAHLAGSGPGYDADAALAVYADAIAAGDPRTRNLYFDVASTVTAERPSDAGLAPLAARLRQLGLERVLFGSDRSAHNDAPKPAWAAFRRLPLTDEELAAIADNVAPYLR